MHCCTAVLGRFVGAWWVLGGWWTAARSLPEMAEYRKEMKLPLLFPVLYNVLKNQPTNCAPRTRCTAVRTAALLYCCTYVVKVWSVGGWRVHCVVSAGWVGRSVRGVFLRPAGDKLFSLFLYKIPASHWRLGVPPSPLLHSSVLYYRACCCTAVLLTC